MPADRSERVMDVVDGALALPAGERAAYLDSASAGDAVLRAEVESLLRFEAAAGRFIEQPAVQLDAAHWATAEAAGLAPGAMLGEHRIIERLGEGGMGDVYLAEDTSLGRKVAIKVLKRGLSADGFRQFLREERILAALNDPHIARLYGGAMTPDGQPYFVMEYVEGNDLDEYCALHGLDLRGRLALFRQVCAAVNYAHQHLVIHRDLKPANIRVTPEGEPMLLDFGIAKLLDPEGSGEPAQTVTMAPVMTPEYASPEQLRNEPVTTASDIYSLGVVLFELLTGKRPFRVKSQRVGDLVRAITETEAPRPSAVAPDRRRELAGDLDNIVRMAMRLEPERRYRSAAEFADDIRRHLEGLPVIARKETAGYVAAKFIQRNKVGVIAAALVALSLIGGMIATFAQARRAERERGRAERRFDEVRRLANSLMFEIHDSVQNLAGSTPTRKLIVGRSLEYLDILAAEAAGNEALQRDLATAYEKVGDIQGNPYNPNLGDTDGALASYRKAEAIRAGAPGAVATPDAKFAQGLSGRSMGDILEAKGDVAAMVDYYRRSLAIFEELARASPGDEKVQDERARANETLGDGLSRLPEATSERRRCYDRLLELRLEWLARFPVNPRYERSLALAYLKVGQAAMPDADRAVASIRKSLGMLRSLAERNPTDERARRDFGQALFSLGNAFIEAREFAAALETRRELKPLRETMAKADPTNQQAQFDLAATEADLAEALTKTGQPSLALEPGRRAVAMLEAISAADPSSALFTRNLGLAQEKMAEVFVAFGANPAASVSERVAHWEEARSWYERELHSFAALQQRGALRPSDADVPATLAEKLAQCGKAIEALRK